MIEQEIASLEDGLTKLVLFEPYDQKLQQDIQFWLAVQGIECLLPDFVTPDRTFQMAIKIHGKIHCIHIPKL